MGAYTAGAALFLVSLVLLCIHASAHPDPPFPSSVTTSAMALSVVCVIAGLQFVMGEVADTMGDQGHLTDPHAQWWLLLGNVEKGNEHKAM